MTRHTILILTLLFGLWHSNVKAQPNIKSTKTDQLILEKHRRQLNLEYTTRELSILQRKNKKLVDSLLNNNNPIYTDGNIVYAPDGKFKIFVFEGNDCGAHCSTFYSAFIHIPSKNKDLIKSIDLLPVTGIYKLPDEKYLILQKGIDGGGNLIDDIVQATLLSFKGREITEHPIVYPNAINKPKKCLYLLQSEVLTDNFNSGSNTAQINFDPKNRRLNYHYLSSEHRAIEEDTGTIYIHSGYFDYINGTFVFQHEKKDIIKK